MDQTYANECLEKLKAVLKDQLGVARYNSWFSDLKVYSADKKTLILTTKEQFIANQLSRRYGDVLYNMAPIYFGEKFETVKVLAESELGKFVSDREKTQLDPKYTFESFVVGNSNLLANAASMAVAECPGTEYNPLFIHGGPGLGKTHLMTAIANFVTAANPDINIEFSNAEKFTNEVVEAIRNKRTQELRSRLRKVDMLFIDDIQFLEGRTTTQEEFFNTFNELYSNGKQIVISSDRPPDAIEKLEERMRSRFKSGIVVAIDKPDTETRMAILRSKAQTLGVKIDDEALFLIADKVDTNIRELEGTLNNANLMAKVSGQSTVTYDIACKCVLNYAIKKADEAAVTPELIIGEVARRYGITEEDILSAKRSREIAVPRQLAIYLTRELCGFSTPKIGSVFGRDHSTVMHACKKTEEMIRESAEFSSVFRQIVASVKGE